ncbi:hypothetical protein TNCV_1119131 [Trichonephila clavipes]|uniref:Uncharacterized protein n=1 Tax=Trichonephila clavipes TaxID=2585209 RepID=A0A8X6VSE2_TRICX|nr:hypothetical protein TNCV_1119131 [Trichonephila clavipes]
MAWLIIRSLESGQTQRTVVDAVGGKKYRCKTVESMPRIRACLTLAKARCTAIRNGNLTAERETLTQLMPCLTLQPLVTSFFKCQTSYVENVLECSPYLNPIERVWDKLGCRVARSPVSCRTE